MVLRLIVKFIECLFYILFSVLNVIGNFLKIIIIIFREFIYYIGEESSVCNVFFSIGKLVFVFE